ncbi:MAG: N-acetyltransferase [Bacteroidales bacterium]|nr:N-acetyltransferase [Bacteroidales bacterium]
MVNIREVNPEADVRSIAAIYRWYVENTTATFELEPLTETDMLRRIEDISSRFPYFVCEDNGEIVGYSYAHTWKKFPAYDITSESTIYLLPQVKGRGIGRALMTCLIDECRQRGILSLIACITAENMESCRFHESLGFIPVSRFRNVGRKFGRLLDVVDYQLQLT